jgi:branched-chain amino acid aminotransferase
METVIYLNGTLVPEEKAKISIFDIGFMYSAVFMEALRTFKHKLYRLEDHLQRLERSLRYTGVGSLIGSREMGDIIQQVLDANISQFEEGDDCWVCAQVTPGQGFPQPLMKGPASQKPTIIAYVSPLPYDEYAKCYAQGKAAVIPAVRNVPASVVDPRAKTRFRLHYFMAKLEAAALDPEAFALLLDNEGFVSEGTGANLFIVSHGQLCTPTTRNILEGISRQTVIELAKELHIPVSERDLTPYDIYTADEGFWTTSSYCVLPLSRVNHRPIGNRIPGPITEKILDAWSAKVGVDIVAQATKYAHRKSNVWRGPAVAVQSP